MAVQKTSGGLDFEALRQAIENLDADLPWGKGEREEERGDETRLGLTKVLSMGKGQDACL